MFLYIAEMCKVLDGIFFLAFRQATSASEEEKDQMTELCKYFRQLWRAYYKNQHLKVKLHLIECHLPEQFRKYGSLGEFVEDHVERLHHRYKIFNRRLANLTNWGAKYQFTDTCLIFAESLECKSSSPR